MKWKQLVDSTIKLLNMYSSSGNLTPISDSSVQDAVLRFPTFANIAQYEIATTVKHIIKNITLTSNDIAALNINNGYYDYSLPTNFYNMMKIESDNALSWKFRGKNKIGIKYLGSSDVDIYYYAYPTDIPDNPSDDFTLDLDEDACQVIPFYVASQILIDDPINKSVGTRLFEIYQGKLANLSNINTQGSQGVKNSMFTYSTNKLY